ncbi:FmdB family zinc ribbon protein [Immundisolibacter sp.]|jgi:putative FmdB family regulatory protein|uniref:FmdB family zinc ribbon protein n=1 Tax=Immundisolibacter sp. TaxID=1934948 RepID=UPI003F824B5E
MPIYEYVCGACGVQRDVMQKVSEPALTQCPQCGAEAFQKQVSAAGFQLKGSGWYVTDFRGNKDKSASSAGGAAKDGTSGGAGEASPATSTATSAPASTAAPAG